MKLTKLVAVAVIALGATLVADTARAADNVWFFNQTDAGLKPCFLFSKAQGWVDFGGVGPQGQFAWGDFRTIVQSELSLPAVPAEATVRFVAVPASSTCPGPGDKVEKKVVFEVDGVANVYIFVGGQAEVRAIGAKHGDDDDHDRR
jgi:hypothetical protein